MDLRKFEMLLRKRSTGEVKRLPQSQQKQEAGAKRAKEADSHAGRLWNERRQRWERSYLD